METPEIRHNRYCRAPTAEIPAHDIAYATFRDNSSTTAVPKQIQYYNSKVRNGELDYNILDALFTELCYEYQARIHSKVKCIPKNLDLFFRGIIEILLNNVGNLDEKTVNLLLDILVLEMVLYSVNDETKLIASTLAGDCEMVLKIISNLIDVLYLNSYIYEGNGGNQSGLIQITEPLRKVLKPAPNANSKYCALLSATIHKLVVTFSTHDVVYFLWSLILADEHSDGKDKQLTMATIALDSMLSVENDINIVYICRDEFWRLICYGLMSDREEQQKQSLYLMKKTLDYVEKEEITVKKGSLMPFVGCQRNDGQLPVEEIKAQFLLMLENLVDNQTCLMDRLAAEPGCLYDCLILGNRLHRTCGNCFDVAYLHCIFKRILTHKSIDIVREGLENIILMDSWLIDNELLILLIEALNNKSLYNPGSKVLLPDIVQYLGQILYCSESNADALINRFICMAATRDWDSVPFFYFIETLAMAVSQSSDGFTTNIWTLKEYRAVVKILDKHIKSQAPPLQGVIANNVAEILSRCAGTEIGLDSIALVLFALGHSFDYDTSNNDHLPTDVHGLCHLNYANNPKIWEALIDYLKENVSGEDVLAYVRRCCTELSGGTSAINIEYFAVMICLLAKAGKDFSPSSVYGQPLSRVFAVVRDIHARFHVDSRVLNKIMELFTCLKKHAFEESTVDAFVIACSSLLPVISPWQESFCHVIMNSLDSSRIPKTFADAKEYISCFEAISSKSCEGIQDFPPEFLQFLQTAWKIIGESAGEVDVRYWYALHIVGVCNRLGIFCDYTTEQMNIFWTAFIDIRPLKLVRTEDCSRENAKIISECCGIISQLIVKNIMQRINSTDMNEVLSKFSNLLENGKEYVILQVIEMHKFSRDIEESTNFNDLESTIFDLSWKIIFCHCEKSNLFWTCLRSLIRIMINSVTLGIPLTSTTALDHLEMMLNSEITRHARMILVSEIYRALVHTSGYRRSCLTEIFGLWLIPLACFLDNNDDKIEVNLYNLHEQCLEKQCCREISIDVYHRVCCVSSILHAMSKLSFGDLIGTALISMLKGFEVRKYAGDSLMQRQKHRMMQLLLLSHSHWSEATVKSVHDCIYHFIVRETNEPTVQVMQEWLLALIYIKNPTMQARIWDLLQEGKDKRPESIPSIATIIHHVSLRLSGEEKCSFVVKAIRELLPCCHQSQKFVVRLYSHVISSKLFQKIRQESDLLPEPSLEKAFHDNVLCDKVEKNSAKLSEDFLLNSFDPIENFDLQTIFYDLPRLLSMSTDECIHPSKFKDYEDLVRNSNIKIENSEDKLSLISPLTQLAEIKKSGVANTVNFTSKSTDVTQNIKTNTMIDKKLGAATLQSTALADDTGLIVVASLINEVRNLGGLARTAETFCARELVLGDLTCTQDREFQISSLSSEKRVTLSEVKPERLQDYLVEKISSGWSIVGAEQTTSSVKIQDMIFKRKTVLLLGNEKSGIPANLIPLLDFCVEIPHQAGVRRSLNAHVTGAICMWHYAKLYIF